MTLQWREANIGPDLANTTWRQWWIEWSPKPGKHTLSVRAINKNGEIQTEKLKRCTYLMVQRGGTQSLYLPSSIGI
jgi:hypothetical protein